MTSETYTALQYAGPDSWHHLIAPTRTFPLTESTTQAAALTMDSTLGHFKDNEAIFALADLSATANILSNAIANSTLTADANTIFKDARTTANTLDTTNKHTPHFTPTFRTYKHFERAANTKDPQVLSMLLIDIIRIANHIVNN